MNTDPLSSFFGKLANTALEAGKEIVVAKNTPQRAAVMGTTPIPQSPVPASEVDPLTVETRSNPAAQITKVAPYLIYGGIILVGGIIAWRMLKK